ncbi:MAG: D-ribose pyranase [Synergistales bacterium]|nr:D-ribose pyranase [Synergistales bacterium]
MKRDGVLHPALSYQIASLGHGDGFAIVDAGMPVPLGVYRVDLGYAHGRPPFFDVLDVLLSSTVVEKAFWAEEAPFGTDEMIRGKLAASCAVSVVPHEELKGMLGSLRFVVRTGECTPYSNIVLQSGVSF